jgi:16S rRNA (adenine1518-N6/adenine1519-N6)-dimethyltransferase
MTIRNKKSLGQHWLQDRATLAMVADYAQISSSDTVLEIGSGQGSLTSELLRRAGRVVAVEYDSLLAQKLPGQFPGKNLQVINQDFLEFNLDNLPIGYKVVANVPYYITSKIIQTLLSAKNKPSVAVLLVQKEVAERLAAKPGDLSILAISAQAYSDVQLGGVVPARLFIPPPKVDSQVVVLKTREQTIFTEVDEDDFFKVVKAGFSAKRKKLRSSLSGGLKIDKSVIEKILEKSAIDPNTRAETLTIDDWLRLSVIVRGIR